MQLRELLGRAIAELRRLAAEYRDGPREPGFPPTDSTEPELAAGQFSLSAGAREMIAIPAPPAPRLETPPPPPLEGSAEDRIARARGLVRS